MAVAPVSGSRRHNPFPDKVDGAGSGRGGVVANGLRDLGASRPFPDKDRWCLEASGSGRRFGLLCPI